MSAVLKMVRSKRIFKVVKHVEKMEFQHLRDLYSADTCQDKVDLTAGVFKTEEGKTWVFPVIRKIEQEMADDPNLNHDYQEFLGDEEFRSAACKLILGADSKPIKENRVLGVQTLSGAGALRMGAELLNKHLNFNVCYIPNETWDNHERVFKMAGFKDVVKYRYWDPRKRSLNFKGLIEDISNAPEHAVLVLQPCAHNPTGCDPTIDQWKKIADIIEERNLFTFFDVPYVGLSTGDIDTDAWPIRHFVDRGYEMMIALSFAKIMGLYGERVGNLCVVLDDPRDKENFLINMQILVRGTYCSPPKHGAAIAKSLLLNEENNKEWRECIRIMADRVKEMRAKLRTSLEKINTPGSWEHVTRQTGMFSFTGLTNHQVVYLREKHHVYIMSSGRLNVCSITRSNVDRVAEAIKDAVTSIPEYSIGA